MQLNCHNFLKHIKIPNYEISYIWLFIIRSLLISATDSNIKIPKI